MSASEIGVLSVVAEAFTAVVRAAIGTGSCGSPASSSDEGRASGAGPSPPGPV